FLHHRFFVRRLGLDRRLHRLVAVFEAAEFYGLLFFLALADNHDLDVLADRRVAYDPRQVAHLLDVLAVQLDDDVPGFDPGGLRRPLVVNTCDERTSRRLEIEAVGDLVGHLLNLDAKPTAADFAVLLQLRRDGLHDLGGHRKADADRAAGRRDDGGVDA